MKTRQQFLLGELAKRIEQNATTPEDRHYLAACLQEISNGNDPSKVFKTKRPRGASNSKLEASARKKMVVVYVAALMRPKYQSESDFSIVMPSGEGLSKEDAIGRAADHFRMDISTIERYWNEYVSMRKKNNSDPLNPFFQFGDLYPE
jgi:hypothetical protein